MDIKKVRLMVNAVQHLSLARNIETITDIVRHTARQITGADGATFVLKDNDKCYYANEDAITPLWKGQRFPLESCVSGWTMLNKKTAIIPDIYKDERVPIEAYKPTFVKSLVMVPIRTIDPIGAIGNYWAQPHEPSPEEIELLQSLADITSVSIENVYAYNELKAQNERLYEIAFLQSHQVRVPIAHILGLYNLFNFENPGDSKNSELLKRLKTSIDELDKMVKQIVDNTYSIQSQFVNPLKSLKGS